MAFAFHSTSEGIELLCSSILESPHAFSTRRGGVSIGDYGTLNLGKSSGDDPERVEENRRRFLSALGLVGPLQVGHQIHGASVNLAPLTAGTQGDVVIAIAPGVPIGVFVADCVPILIEDPRTHAIAAVHAGWRGTAQGAARAAVQAMRESFGSDPGELRAAIGPSIGGCCYQVGPEVIEALGALPDREAFVHSEDGHFYVDLQEANRQWLVDSGVTSIDVSGLCTACDAEHYFSYRRDGERSGRMLAVIARS